MKQMSLAEAKAEGLLDGKPKLKRTTRQTAPRNGAPSRCTACGTVFTTDASETRHVEETGHARYETVLT
jgi:uncharacterized C2H2 Zn-finger protein